MTTASQRPSTAGWWWRLRACAAVARMALRAMLIYRAGLVISVLVLLLQIFALRVVWTSVYADRGSVAGGSGEIALPTQLAYVSLSTIQFWALNQWSGYSLPQRIREGRVGADLARPVGLLPQLVMARLGATLGGLPFAVAAVPLALLLGGAAPPADFAALTGYLASTLLALVIATSLSVLIELTAFWTLEVTGFWLSYSMVSRFLSGSLVPLWFMPEWLRALATVLPFQATTYSPVAIYLGTIDGAAVWGSLGISVVWVVLLWLVMRLVWSRALRRVVVQGG